MQRGIIRMIISFLMIITMATLSGQTIWNGAKMAFTKADYADSSLEENQDRITSETWLTRNDSEGIFNAYLESSFDRDTYTSPLNTEWAYGTIADYDILSYQSWNSWHGGNPPSSVGRDAVLHLISEDIYMDIKFTSWTENGNGGGFSYERSMDVDSGPVKIYLSRPIIYDGAPAGTLAATLSTADGDISATHTYSFAAGGLDNSSFYISGDSLFTNFTADMDIQSSYSINLRSTNDSSSLFCEKSFVMEIVVEPEIWDGARIHFTKADYADCTLSENQDRITENNWITRNNSNGIFNAATESYFVSASPANTEWAYGNTSNYFALSFRNWVDWHNWNPPSTVGRDAVLHLISEDIYIDIKFTSWTEGGDGGGFSYERALSTDSGPLDVKLSKSYVFDASPAGTLVGELSSFDGDISATHTFSFIEGVNDNSSFYISGDSLFINFTADSLIQNAYTVEIASTNDSNSKFLNEQFQISVVGEATVWKGPMITFVKYNYADCTLEENQDRMTETVWITRNNEEGLFNAYGESGYYENGAKIDSSPSDTEWASGTTDEFYNLTYLSWYDWVQSIGGAKSPPDAVGVNAVLHLISENIYIDIKFCGWTQDGEGGGFIYQRSTPDGTIVPEPKIWNGTTKHFSKADDADPNLAENQDVITEYTSITRAETEGIYNAFNENSYDYYTSPTNTLWAYGTTAVYQNLDFKSWIYWHDQNPPSTVNRSAVLYLIEENAYIDIKFTDWTEGGGGGFSYDRSTYPDPGPYGLFLSDKSIVDEDSVGTSVGFFSSLDEGDVSGHTYSFAAGGIDNGYFTISGNELLTDFTADIDIQSIFNIKIRTTNNNDNLYYERDLQITVIPLPVIWSGPIITFTKNNYADCTLEENQDRLTSETWITRNDSQGLFNAFSESYYNTPSPANTEWAFGTTSEWNTLTYTSWYDWFNSNPYGMVGQDAVVHLISENIYIDIKFCGWTQSAGGGGFIYQRSTPNGTIVPETIILDGPIVSFSKADYADYTLEENQDRITESTWITRGDDLDIFNIANETSYTNYTSPTNTLWASGTTADIENLDFKTWAYWNNWNPSSIVDTDAVLYLVSENIYLDIKFTSWSLTGGGFSYERKAPKPVILWTGPDITFTRPSLVDWTLPENQDRMTDSTWIARQNTAGIFNAVMESSYITGSPTNTEWAYGTLADYDTLSYLPWVTWAANNPTGTIGKDAVLHLISENIYMDIKFTSYAGGGTNGAFSYVRSTPYLESPQNVVIAVDVTDLLITWDAVADATGYKVFASDDPYGTFADVSGDGIFDGLSWSYDYTGNKKFFYVIAVFGAKTEPVKNKIITKIKTLR